MPKPKRKLLPLKLTVHQIKRVMGLKVGEGFFVWKSSGPPEGGSPKDGTFDIVEFRLDLETGQLLNSEGEPIIWYGLDDDGKPKVKLSINYEKVEEAGR